MLQSDLCDYNNAYIVVKGKTIVTGANNRNRRNRFLASIKINNVLIDNAEDLDVVMLMCNLIEYSKIYRKTTGMELLQR